MQSETQLFLKEVEDVLSKLVVADVKNANDLLNVILPLIKIASKYTNLSGSSKKNLVIESVKALLNKSNLTDDVKTPLLLAVDVIIPPLIDKIYAEEFKKLCSCCM